MKKILLSLIVVLSASLQAQTFTQAAAQPTPWDPAYTILQCDSLGILPGASGAGQTWNFSSVVTHSSIAKTYASSVNTNNAYSPAYVFVSASASDNSYYNTINSNLKYYGGNFMITTFAVSLTYTVPAIVAQYPMSLGTTTSTSVGGSVTVNGSLNGTFSGNSSFLADATGTLVLAGKTFTDVVRVKRDQALNATLSLGTATVTQLTYDYYSAAAPKVPIFTIATSTIVSIGGTSSQTIVTILQNYPVAGVNENQKQATELSVFPNPATSVLNFNTTNNEANKVIAYDLTGKFVATEFFELGKSKMNINHLSNGLYLYTVTGKNNQVLTTGKFTVSK